VRSADGEAKHVLVVGGTSGVATGLRRGRRRRGRAREAERDPPPVPITRLTVIRPGGFATADEAEAWLERSAADAEEADGLAVSALGIVNRALHAHRVATQDPGMGGVSVSLALATRLGFGTGDELADGRWSEAVELPPPAGPRRRADALRPQERMAAQLGRRERVDACETLLLRARADLDAERGREAALQLRVGLEALLAEVSADTLSAGGEAERLGADHTARQAEDLAFLSGRRSITGDAANEALRGELSPGRTGEVAETLEVCERVLRRRRVLAR
jgi:hypothetical protein